MIQDRVRTRMGLAALVCLVLGLLCLSCLGCASTVTGTALNVGVVGAGVFDLATTRQAIGRGAMEANPVMGQGAAQQTAMKAAGAALIIWLASALEEHGATTAAHWVRGITIGAWGGAAVWNQSVRRGR